MYYTAGNLFLVQGDSARAINSYQKAVDLDPDLLAGWHQLGDLFLARGDEKSMSYYRNLIGIKSTKIEHLMGLCLCFTGFWKIRGIHKNVSKGSG